MLEEVIDLERFRFWPFLFGAIVTIWGTATLGSRILAIQIGISWWATFAIAVGISLLIYAVRNQEKPA